MWVNWAAQEPPDTFPPKVTGVPGSATKKGSAQMAVCTVCWNDKDLSVQAYTLGGEKNYNVLVCKGCHYNLRKSIQIVRTLGQTQLELLEGSEGEGGDPPNPPESPESHVITDGAPGGRQKK